MWHQVKRILIYLYRKWLLLTDILDSNRTDKLKSLFRTKIEFALLSPNMVSCAPKKKEAFGNGELYWSNGLYR